MNDAGEEITERVLMSSLQEFMRMNKRALFEVCAMLVQGFAPESELYVDATLSQDVWSELEQKLQEQNIPYQVKRVDVRTQPPSITISIPEAEISRLSDLQAATVAELLTRGEEVPSPDVKIERPEGEAKAPEHVAEVAEELRREGVDMNVDIDKDASLAHVTLSTPDGENLVPRVQRACERAGVTPPAIVEDLLSPEAAALFATAAKEAGLAISEDGTDSLGEPVVGDARCVKVAAADGKLHGETLGAAARSAREQGLDEVAQELDEAGASLGERTRFAEQAVHGTVDIAVDKEALPALKKECEREGIALTERGSAPDGSERASVRVPVSQQKQFETALRHGVRELDDTDPKAAAKLREDGSRALAKMSDEKAARKPWMKNRAERARDASVQTEKSRAFAKDKNRDFER